MDIVDSQVHANVLGTETTIAIMDAIGIRSVVIDEYLAPGEGGQGLGRRLYATLFDALEQEDIHRAFGGITLPNAPSVGVHKAAGFEHIGTYREIGRKFGRYWDVALYLKPLE